MLFVRGKWGGEGKELRQVINITEYLHLES